MSILTMKNIKKKYDNSAAALDNVSLTVGEGEAVAVIGSSGSGKSTLLRCVNCLERVDSGEITIAGETLVTGRPGEKPSYPKEREIRRICTKTAMVFQHFNLFMHLTCLENIAVAPIKILGINKTEAYERARNLLETVGLSDKAGAYPDMLSGGQKQRVAIARALAVEPRIMLFDEPTSALDPEITNEVTSVIAKLARQKITMLIVTHDMRFARSAASRVIYMDAGRIVEEGTPEQIFENPASNRLKEFIGSLDAVYSDDNL